MKGWGWWQALGIIGVVLGGTAMFQAGRLSEKTPWSFAWLVLGNLILIFTVQILGGPEPDAD